MRCPALLLVDLTGPRPLELPALRPAWPRAFGSAAFPPDFCMSMLPRKCAPSAIATRGAAMSPSTEPLSRMSTFSLAVTLPVTSPRMTTDFAKTCALIRPFGPMVRTFWRSSILPSTCPSMVRSSLPLSSPLMTTDFPMFTADFSIPRRGSLATLEGRTGLGEPQLAVLRHVRRWRWSRPGRRRFHRFIPFPHWSLSTQSKEEMNLAGCSSYRRESAGAAGRLSIREAQFCCLVLLLLRLSGMLQSYRSGRCVSTLTTTRRPRSPRPSPRR